MCFFTYNKTTMKKKSILFIRISVFLLIIFIINGCKKNTFIDKDKFVILGKINID